MKEPILITGCARSGTSMVAGIIDICGAFGGITFGSNRYNSKGMYENRRIREGILKPYLRSLGVDPLGQYPLPDNAKLEPVPTLRVRVRNAIKADGYHDGFWYYKGAKMCLHWSVWHQAFPRSKWIIVRREKEDIINSCLHTGFMRAFRIPRVLRELKLETESEGWGWWVDQHIKRFEEMKQAGLKVMEIHPSAFVDGDYSEIKEIISWLGLKWTDEIISFIEPKLWKSQQKTRNL